MIDQAAPQKNTLGVPSRTGQDHILAIVDQNPNLHSFINWVTESYRRQLNKEVEKVGGFASLFLFYHRQHQGCCDRIYM